MKMTDRDKAHVWHPYSAFDSNMPVFAVKSAKGVRLTLENNQELIDGMASWWCVIHGYNHPVLNTALENQIHSMSHVMFGGLTHEPAVALAERLVELTPEPLTRVFFADSGSVAVEAAMKLAIQYWRSCGQNNKQRFLTPRNGYHGDTLHAMSVCDPVNGMHGLFAGVLPEQFFFDAPETAFGDLLSDTQLESLRESLVHNHEQLAAVILEPIVQGAGGMRFYSADYLKAVRRLCDEYDVLLIADEIATGFGRTGKLFACEHAAIAPDILCLGKALTGGYMTLSAVLTTQKISHKISQGEPGVFMHGPTFMGNPLACAVALASIDLLLASPWRENVEALEVGLKMGLSACTEYSHVENVRVLGAIGVVELTEPVDMALVQPMFVERGVWVRPFGKLIYLMPPFVMSPEDLAFLCAAVRDVVASLHIEGGKAVPKLA